MGKIGDFVGIYECPNGPSFELTEDTYTLTGMAPEKIANKLAVEKGIILTLSDGYLFRRLEDRQVRIRMGQW